MRYPGIEKATREVFKALGYELVELEGAGCCPAPGVVRSFDEATWLALAARNLAIAEKQGVDIMTICNGCYGSLFDVAHILHEHPEKLKAGQRDTEGGRPALQRQDQGAGTSPRYCYNDIGIEKIKASVKNPLDLNVAVHYGCHFVRPSKIKHMDDPERPHILDELVEWTGAKSVDYKDKQMCCGAGGGVRSGTRKLATEFTAEKLKNIKAAGGQYIIDVCPFCHLQFDRTQKDPSTDTTSRSSTCPSSTVSPSACPRATWA